MEARRLSHFIRNILKSEIDSAIESIKVIDERRPSKFTGVRLCTSAGLHRRRDWHEIYLTPLCHAEWMMSLASKYLICSGDTGPQTNFPASATFSWCAETPAAHYLFFHSKGPAAAATAHRILIIERTTHRVPGGDRFWSIAAKMHRNRCVACPTTVAFNHTSLWPRARARQAQAPLHFMFY